MSRLSNEGNAILAQHLGGLPAKLENAAGRESAQVAQKALQMVLKLGHEVCF